MDCNFLNNWYCPPSPEIRSKNVDYIFLKLSKAILLKVIIGERKKLTHHEIIDRIAE